MAIVQLRVPEWNLGETIEDIFSSLKTCMTVMPCVFSYTRCVRIKVDGTVTGRLITKLGVANQNVPNDGFLLLKGVSSES